MKDNIFQCYINWELKEDTELITHSEAVILWDKYFPYCKDDNEYQMVIWQNCTNTVDFSDCYKEIDSRD